MQTNLMRKLLADTPLSSLQKSLFFFSFLFLSSTLIAQKDKNAGPDVPSYGQVDKTDLQLKDCDFDDKADAMVLIDDGELAYVFGSGIELNRRVRVKILNNKGLEWANVHLPYRELADRSQYITKIEAQTYNLDNSGNVITTKVDKKLIYDKKLNKKYYEKVFTFPEAKVGSVIEYKYSHRGVGLLDWYFQRSIPVRFSRFTIDFPTEVEFAVSPHCAREFERKQNNSSNRNVSTYTMHKVPALHDEPFIINEDHYRDRLVTKVIAFNVDGRRVARTVNWVQVIKYLMEDEDFGVQIKKNIPRTADLEEKLKPVSSDYDKMKIIYKYVQDNMHWNESPGIWALEGVKSAWKDKKGTVGEINLILVNLLKDAGLNAHPILVSTHDNGVVNALDPGTYESPGFMQFNKVMAYLVLNNVPYVLDATQKNTPVHLMPADVLLTQGLVIEKLETFEWGWKTLWREGAMSKTVVALNGVVGANGIIKGEASINSYDYARLDRIGTAKSGKDKFISKYVTDANAGLQVEDVEFINLDSDSLPLVQKMKFTQPLNTAGEYRYFSVNLLTGLEKNPFVADNRSADVFFGSKQKIEILGSFLIEDGYEFAAPPKNMKMIMPDTSIVVSRLSQVNDNLLQTRIQLEFKRPIYEVTEYPDLQDFYQRLFEVLNEQFVVRKKAK